MRVWQIVGRGEGFVREGKVFGFELTGLVSVDGPSEAFEKRFHLRNISTQSSLKPKPATSPAPSLTPTK